MFRRNRFIAKCIVDCRDDLWIWLLAGMAFAHGYGILIITTRAMALPFIWLSNNYTSHQHEVSRIHVSLSLPSLLLMFIPLVHKSTWLVPLLFLIMIHYLEMAGEMAYSF
jgi:hypothetical protein